jgi:hypothetical protein
MKRPSTGIHLRDHERLTLIALVRMPFALVGLAAPRTPQTAQLAVREFRETAPNDQVHQGRKPPPEARAPPSRLTSLFFADRILAVRFPFREIAFVTFSTLTVHVSGPATREPELNHLRGSRQLHRSVSGLNYDLNKLQATGPPIPLPPQLNLTANHLPYSTHSMGTPSNLHLSAQQRRTTRQPYPPDANTPHPPTHTDPTHTHPTTPTPPPPHHTQPLQLTRHHAPTFPQHLSRKILIFTPRVVHTRTPAIPPPQPTLDRPTPKILPTCERANPAMQPYVTHT